MQVIGTVAGLQVQVSSLKVGEKPRRYDPAPLQAMPALTLTPGGVVGEMDDETSIIDVHHAEHPLSKNSGGKNGISLGFTAHYAAMRDRFGPQLTDGIAGENILIETDRLITAEELAGGIVIDGEDGPLELRRVIVAAPCVEFSRFALQLSDDEAPDTRVTEALRFLHQGMRGFYATYAGEPARVRRGARVMLA